MRTESASEHALAAWRRALDEVHEVKRELAEARRHRDRPRVATLTAAAQLLTLRSDLLLANAVSIAREAERSDVPRRGRGDPVPDRSPPGGSGSREGRAR